MKPSSPLPGKWKGLLYIPTAALLLSSAGLFIKALSLGAFPISFYRSLVAGLTILLVLRVRRQPWTLDLDIGSLACSVCYAGVLVLFVLATKLTTAANAICLQYTAPIFLLFLEPWAFKLPFPRKDLWVVAACMGGMALFFAGHLAAGGALGNLLALASGLCLALFSLLLKWKRTQRSESPFGVVVLGNFLVALVCLPMALGHLRVTPGQGLALLYLGVFQLGFSWMLFTLGMKYLSATAAVVTCMLEAILNPIWVFLGVGERPSGFALLGGAVVLGVVAWYNLKKTASPQPVD
ncbi:MAG: DMT family transporter [Holophaga sp.]|nr:DMT family transporter [Holophaga sp.]